MHGHWIMLEQFKSLHQILVVVVRNRSHVRLHLFCRNSVNTFPESVPCKQVWFSMVLLVEVLFHGFKTRPAKFQHTTSLRKVVESFKWLVKMIQPGTMVSSRLFCIITIDDCYAWTYLGVITTNSIFYGRPNPNSWCIGIEFSRNVQNNNIMPEVQIAAGVRLVADIKRRYKGINIYTHDQFNVGRTCPGPNFPLARFKNA